MLLASIAFRPSPAHATPLSYEFGGQNSTLYNRALLTRFADDRGYHVVDLTRHHAPTYGDPLAKSANGGPLLPINRLELPHFVDANGRLPSWLLMKDQSYRVSDDDLYGNWLPISHSCDLDQADVGSSCGDNG